MHPSAYLAPQPELTQLRIFLVLPALVIFVFFYLIAIADLAILPAIKTCIYLIFFGFSVGNALLGKKGASLTLTEILVFTFIGIMACSVLDLAILANGFNRNITLALTIPAALYGIYKAFSCHVLINMPTRESVIASALLLLLLFSFAFNYLAPGTGSFPPIFINVDTPFYLSQTHALINETTWPAASLNVSGVRVAYHYGVQNAAALISRFSGAPAHISLFTICCGLMVVVMGATIYSIARSLKGRWPLWFPIGLLFVFVIELSPALGHIRLGSLYALPNKTPHPGGLFGYTAALICAYAITAGRITDARLVATVTIISAASRTTNFLALIMGFGLQSLLKTFERRSLWAALPFVVAACLSALLIVTFAYGSSGATLKIAPGSLVTSSDYSEKVDHLTEAVSSGNYRAAYKRAADIFLSSAAAISFLLTIIAFGFSISSIRLDIFAYIVPPLLFLNLFAFDNTGFVPAAGENTHNLSQALSNMLAAQIFFWWALLVAYIGTYKALRQNWLASVSAVGLHILIGTAIGVALIQTISIIKDPTKTYEYVDNRTIADALKHIPVQGSVLVTNDVRYPANNFARNDRQFQLAAVLGHQNFASTLRYVPAPDAPARKRLNAMLAGTAWSDELNEAAKKYGWTHFIVHKSAPHPEQIPLRAIYENNDYIVYQFQ